jgi:hypothetical protein
MDFRLFGLLIRRPKRRKQPERYAQLPKGMHKSILTKKRVETKIKYMHKNVLKLSKTGFIFFVLSCQSSIAPLNIEPQIGNPTSYLFFASRQDVEKAISDALGGRNFHGYYLYYSKFGDKNYYLRPGEENILSKVYFRKNGRAFEYCPEKFEIILESIDENITKVSIIVIEPCLETQLEFNVHLFISRRREKVPATTVEEYEILLKIGLELNEENMPKLLIPQKIVYIPNKRNT